MKRLLDYSPRHPWLTLALLLAVTLVAALQLDRLSLHVSASSMMIEHSDEKRFYDEVAEQFGSESTALVFVADENLLDPANLAALKQAVDAIEALPFVTHTDSLFSVSNIRNEDGYISSIPFLDPLPQTAEEAAAAVASAAGNPLIAGNLVSENGHAMAINVHLAADGDSPARDAAITEDLEKAIAPLTSQLDTAFQLGGSYLRQAIDGKIRSDQTLILPLAAGLLLVTVGLALRSAHATLVPLITAALSVVWTLGLMAALDIPIDVLTSIVPALIIIIGSTEDIHMLSDYQAEIRHGRTREKAVATMSRRLSTAVTLTFVTTYVGFLSIAVNDIALLQRFGLVASTGLLFNFLITILVVPLYLSYLGERPAKTKRSGQKAWEGGVRMVDGLCRYKRALLWSLLPLVLVFGHGATRLHVDNDPTSFFDSSEPVVERSQRLHEDLAGINTFSIVLDSGIEGTFLKVRYLEELKKLQEHLTATGHFDKSSSFADYIEFVNKVMDDDVDELALPEIDDLVQEYMLFIDADDVKDFVSKDFSTARIVVRHNINSSERLLHVLDELKAHLATSLDKGLDAKVTGESVLTAQAADTMARGQAQSLILMLAVIIALISVLFVNLKAGLLASLPTLLPIVVLFGVMGFAGIPLDTGTAMVAAIALGISVDDTMHFMVRYHANTRRHRVEMQALRATVREEATPIIATSVALGLGFAVLAVSEFPPVVHFGVLSAMVMMLSLIATFVLMPLLLSSVSLITMWDVLSLKLRSAVVDRCALFDSLSPRQIKRVILLSEMRKFHPGEIMVNQGAEDREMYVLLEGSADVMVSKPDGSSLKVADLATGDVFGEVGLVAGLPRTANVVARGSATTLVLSWPSMDRIARQFPRIAARVYRNISGIVADRLAEQLAARTSSESKEDQAAG